VVDCGTDTRLRAGRPRQRRQHQLDRLVGYCDHLGGEGGGEDAVGAESPPRDGPEGAQGPEQGVEEIDGEAGRFRRPFQHVARCGPLAPLVDRELARRDARASSAWSQRREERSRTRASLDSGSFLPAASISSPPQCCGIAPGLVFPTCSRQDGPTECFGSVAMGAVIEPPPGKEPVMRVMRRAAVLMILLGLSLGTSGIFAAPARSQAHRPAKTAVRRGAGLFEVLWRGIVEGWMKEGPRIDPLGSSNSSNGTQIPDTKEGPGADPLGSAGSSNGSQAPSTESGAGSDPLGSPR